MYRSLLHFKLTTVSSESGGSDCQVSHLVVQPRFQGTCIRNMQYIIHICYGDVGTTHMYIVHAICMHAHIFKLSLSYSKKCIRTEHLLHFSDESSAIIIFQNSINENGISSCVSQVNFPDEQLRSCGECWHATCTCTTFSLRIRAINMSIYV